MGYTYVFNKYLLHTYYSLHTYDMLLLPDLATGITIAYITDSL